MTGEFKNLIIQVVSSWQVITVTVVVLLYIFLINYVARLYHRRKASPLPGPMRAVKKAKKNEKNEDTEEVIDDSAVGLEK